MKCTFFHVMNKSLSVFFNFIYSLKSSSSSFKIVNVISFFMFIDSWEIKIDFTIFENFIDVYRFTSFERSIWMNLWAYIKKFFKLNFFRKKLSANIRNWNWNSCIWHINKSEFYLPCSKINNSRNIWKLTAYLSIFPPIHTTVEFYLMKNSIFFQIEINSSLNLNTLNFHISSFRFFRKSRCGSDGQLEWNY